MRRARGIRRQLRSFEPPVGGSLTLRHRVEKLKRAAKRDEPAPHEPFRKDRRWT